MKKLYLVDVSSLYFRAFYAIRPLSNSSGMPTNALYGFLSMVVKLLKQSKSDQLVFCFDNKHPTFRKEIYDQYKANRSEMPEELVPQVPYVRKLTDALGIAAFDITGYEADDLIGSLTTFATQHETEVVIVSGDKDFGQLVGPSVVLYDTMKNVRYDEKGVEEKWGIPPRQVIDYLSLCGDSSDNIPGVRGIGPKGAQKLLAEFDTLEEIYQSLGKIKNKNLAKKLEESKDLAFLSKKLVTIVTDLQLVDSLDELKMKPVDREGLLALLDELDFKSFAKNLLGQNIDKEETESSASQESASSPQEAAVELKKTPTKELKEISADLSTLDREIPSGSELWGLWTERGLYLSDEQKVMVVHAEVEKVGQLLSEKRVKWLGEDVKELWKSLSLEGPQAVWDQRLAAYVVQAGAIGSFEDLYLKYVGGEMVELPSPSQLMQSHFELRDALKKELRERKVEGVLQEIELPLVPVLYDMEKRGILIHTPELREQSQELAADIKKLEEKIHQEAGEVFNVASTKQLAHVLFEKMEIPPVKKTKTGFSTDNDVLEKLSEEHVIARYMIEFRELSKLKSTYVDALEALVKSDGRIHTHFNQALTATGRLSSHDPNLQNIPIRTPRGSRIRRAFVAEKGKTFLSVDYSQIELRVLAHITGDPGLCQAFAQDQDIHSATASQIFNTPIEQVTSDQRRSAKAVNFGIAYGQGPFGLAETLGISRKEATEIIAQYFNRFSGVREFMELVVEQGKKDGYVQSIFGRRRYLPELSSKNARLRKFGERAAINAPMQGTASDLVKMAMTQIAKEGVSGLLLQVHDELLFEVDDREIDAMQKKVKDIMENVCELKVPLKVNCATGKNWEEAHA